MTSSNKRSYLHSTIDFDVFNILEVQLHENLLWNDHMIAVGNNAASNVHRNCFAVLVDRSRRNRFQSLFLQRTLQITRNNQF